MGIFEPQLVQQHLAQLLAWVAEGRLVPPPPREFAFEDYATALEFALSGKGLGKAILRVAEG